MPDPTSSNILLSLPLHGSNVDTWDVPVNGDFTALDGFFGGVQTISLSNSNVTLTAPSGTPTPAAGPTQSQNAVLRLTGTLSGNLTVTLPLPGYIIVENRTTGNFVVVLRAVGSGEIICVDQGEIQHVYNDGTNVRFVNLGRIGEVQTWAGISAMPAWVTSCTVPPYLLCDGTVYNFSTYPYLGKRLGATFGGNGITTFGVPDLRGRIPLTYDGTGTRITSAGSGLNGQTLGASLDSQSVVLTTPQIPAHNHGVTDPGHGHGSTVPLWGHDATGSSAGGGGAFVMTTAIINSAFTGISVQNAGGGGSHPNVQPSLVTGLSVIRAA